MRATLRRTGSLLSHLFLFEVPTLGGRVIGISDGGMNTYPDLNAKVKIVENAVACYHRIGVPQPKIAALATLRSLIMRGIEATALRHIVIDLLQRTNDPLVVMGDFNDSPHSVTTQLVAATSDQA